jgi:hypothetical protein
LPRSCLAVAELVVVASLNVRFGELIVLTILASPHLISYDLLLLTIPLLVFADWAVQHQDRRFSAAVPVALVLLYFAPFSGMIVARLIGVQIAVIVMAWVAWMMGARASRRLRSLEDRPCRPESRRARWRSSAA